MNFFTKIIIYIVRKQSFKDFVLTYNNYEHSRKSKSMNQRERKELIASWYSKGDKAFLAYEMYEFSPNLGSEYESSTIQLEGGYSVILNSSGFDGKISDYKLVRN